MYSEEWRRVISVAQTHSLEGSGDREREIGTDNHESSYWCVKICLHTWLIENISSLMMTHNCPSPGYYLCARNSHVARKKEGFIRIYVLKCREKSIERRKKVLLIRQMLEKIERMTINKIICRDAGKCRESKREREIQMHVILQKGDGRAPQVSPCL